MRIDFVGHACAAAGRGPATVQIIPVSAAAMAAIQLARLRIAVPCFSSTVFLRPVVFGVATGSSETYRGGDYHRPLRRPPSRLSDTPVM